jgi:O-antigen ligase
MTLENVSAFPKRLSARSQWSAFAVLTAIFLLCIKAPSLLVLALGALLVLPALLYLAFRLIDGDAELVMLLWVGIFPLGYYFLSFPRDQAIITFDRVAVLMLAAAIVLCPRDRVTEIPNSLRRCGLAWFAFLAACLVSLVSVKQFLFPLRLWVDAFLLPVFIGWYVVACFPVRRYLRLVHGIVCVVAIYSAAIGAAEMVLGRNLMVLPGAGDYFAGQQEDIFIFRPNGPYLATHSFGMIGLATFCLLGFLRHVVGNAVPRWQRVLHGLGVTAALLQTMMTLSRSFFIIIILICFLDLFQEMSWRQKAVRIGVLATMSLAVVAMMVTVPVLFKERVSETDNIYARIAQQEQNLSFFLDHPILGVGLTNFYAVAMRKPWLGVSYGDVESMDVPHSNIGSVLTETGLVGFIPYALSQCLLVVAFWQLRRTGERNGRLAWIFFIYIFLSYSISGLAFASAYSSDLNLWYLFCFAVIYKYAVTKDSVGDARPDRVRRGEQNAGYSGSDGSI